jgi:hypothetical protein
MQSRLKFFNLLQNMTEMQVHGLKKKKPENHLGDSL